MVGVLKNTEKHFGIQYELPLGIDGVQQLMSLYCYLVN